jgi:hypothetical protein
MGMRSPTNGMNSAMFMAVDNLLFVIEYNKPDMKESNMSPINGVLNNGAAK